MTKRVKIVVISLVTILIIGIIGVIVAQQVLTKKIENYLSTSLPENMKVTYDHLDLSILSGSLHLENPKMTRYIKATDSIILKVTMESLDVKDFGVIKYLMNKNIHIDEIILQEPQIEYFQTKSTKSEAPSDSNSNDLKDEISVGHFKVENANIKMFDIKSDSLVLKMETFNLNLFDIEVNKEILQEKIPFHFENYELSFSNFFNQLNAYDNLEIKNSKISQSNISFNNLKLYTKVSKQELSQIIPFERDHYDLKIENIKVNDQEFGYRHDSIFYFKSPKVEILNPILNIYRDKLVVDDTTIKSLYSKMLRNLKFELTLSEVSLQNTIINYSEKVKAESAAGLISFKNLNGSIKNLSNTYADSEKTTVDLDGVFMKTTPIKVNWYFGVNNVNDQFIFKAEIGRLPAEDLNPFSEPNLNVRFEGDLLKTYFTIDGNSQNSNVDLRANYNDFKVSVLDKEGKGKNKFLSAVANLFIKKGSDEESDNFREGSKSDIERDKTKSVFNFIWISAKSGLLSVMTGDGKK